MKGDQINLQVGYGTAKGHHSLAVGTEAAQKAVRHCKESPLAAVLVFASVRYELEEVLLGIHEVVGDAPVLGATTAGEICNGPQQESVVVVALASPYLQVRVGVGQRVSRDWRQAVAQAVSAPDVAPFFSSRDSNIWRELTLEGKSAFGLLFSPGNTKAADSHSFGILEELKRLSLGQVPFVGGAAADDWHLEANYVLWGRQAYPDSVLVAIFETQLRFGLALAHGFRPTTRRATVTRVHHHEVLELDGRPAAEIYSRLQGTTREALEGKHLTLTTGRPMGIAVGFGEYSLNVASFFTAAGGVRFAQPVLEGSVLTVMEAEVDDLVAAGVEAFHKALTRGAIIDPALALVFPCALRTPLLGARNHDAISGIRNLVPGVPVTGFYSFGEQGLFDDGQNRHNNEVIAVLALGRQLSYAAQVALENARLSTELLTARDQLQRLLSCSPAVIYSCMPSEDYVATYISENLTAQLGYEPWEFLADSHFWRNHIHPEDAPRILAGLPSLFEKGFYSHEYRFRHKDGSWRWMHDDLTLIRDARGEPHEIIGYWIDVTERRQAEEALRNSKEEWERTFDAVPDLIAILDREYRIIRSNQSMARALGKTPSELIGKFCYEVVHRSDQPHHLCPYNLLLHDGKEHTAELRVLDRDFLITVAPIYDRDDHCIGSVHLARDITERKKAEEALSRNHQELQVAAQRLAQSRNTLQLIIESIPVRVFWKDRNSRFMGCNTLFAQDAGLSQPQELLGKDDFAMGWREQAELYRADDRQVMESRRPKLNIVEPQTTPTGAKIWLNTSKVPLQGPDGEVFGVLGVYEDITERKQSEEALRQTNETLRATLDAAPLAIFDLDTEGRVKSLWNPAAEQMLGWRCEEVLGQFLPSVPEESKEEFARFRALIRAGKSIIGKDLVRRRKDGSRIDYSLYAAPEYDADGLVIGNIAVLVDITERKRAEAERLRFSKLESLATLAGGIAHDFNNILTAIMGNISLSRLDLQNAEATRKNLQATENACQEARRLAQQLLTFAQGGAPLKELMVVEDLVTKTGIFACSGSKARITFSFPDDLWAVEADPGQISQVIQNLVINAREAMPTGGTITVKAENLEVAAPSDLPLGAGKYVKISIYDQGVGISAQHLPSIFDPYFTTKQTGSGLGLATAYSIVRNHAGHIAVESAVGVGTTFHVYLPAVGHKIRTLSPKEVEIVAGQGKILVMDDEEIVRNILGKMLGRLGYEFDLSGDGAEALKLFTLARESGQAYDAVILDLTVPGSMGGKETLEQLLQIDPEVKAIVSSGYSHDAIMAEFAQYGFSGVIAKPYRISDLSKVLAAVIAKGK